MVMDVLHPPKATRVLVVEDEEAMRRLVCEVLRRMRIDVIDAAANGEAAIGMMNPHQPWDLVVCDWNMPKMSGIEVLRRVRETAPSTTFLMTTGRTDSDSVRQAKAGGIGGYLVKPFSPVQLQEKVRLLLDSRAGKSAPT